MCNANFMDFFYSRNEGNRFFQRDDIKTSIEKYAQAFKLGKNNRP